MDRATEIALCKKLLHYVDTRTTALADAIAAYLATPSNNSRRKFVSQVDFDMLFWRQIGFGFRRSRPGINGMMPPLARWFFPIPARRRACASYSST